MLTTRGLLLIACCGVATAFRGATPLSPIAAARAGGGARRLQCQQQSPGGASKGLNVLELTGALLPQGALVTTVKTGWRMAWATLMRELAPQSKEGDYVRPSYGFKGEIGTSAFPDEPSRYHLYVGKACPWCHRVELARSVRGLGDYISLTTVLDRPEGKLPPALRAVGFRPLCRFELAAAAASHAGARRAEASRGGWVFTAASPDPVVGAKDLREVYDALTGGYRGRCTAPLLVDKKQKKLVSNESADLMRMLNEIKVAGVGSSIDLCPQVGVSSYR